MARFAVSWGLGEVTKEERVVQRPWRHLKQQPLSTRPLFCCCKSVQDTCKLISSEVFAGEDCLSIGLFRSLSVDESVYLFISLCLCVDIYMYVYVYRFFFFCFVLFVCFKSFIYPFAGNSGRLTWVRLSQLQGECYPFRTVHAVFSCFQTKVWLPMFEIFNVRTDVNAWHCMTGAARTP